MTQGLSTTEKDRLSGCLDRLMPHVFPDMVGSLVDARTIAIGEHLVQVLPLARIFEHKVRTLTRASETGPIDPKHVDDARVLGDALGRPVSRVAAGALAPDVYGIEADWSCERCELSSHSSWPLAPKDQIFELLGWNRQPNIVRPHTDTHQR